MRSLLIVALLAATAIAGCSGDAASKDPDDGLVTDDTFDDIDVDATKDTGVIRGIVVDQVIQPLEGVRVTLATPSGEMETTTNELGAFGFDELEPGTYFVKAHKLGYEDVQQSVEVVAGLDEPGIVKILLNEAPGLRPFFEALHFEGFLECSAVTVVFFWPCELPEVGELGNDNYFESWNLTSEATHMHVSLLWDATQPFGTELYFNLLDSYDAGYNVVAYSGGPSPQVGNAGPDALGPINAAGTFAVEVAGNGEQGTGIGLSVQQDFDAFVIVFHGFQPPEGYAFWSDGAPQVPE